MLKVTMKVERYDPKDELQNIVRQTVEDHVRETIIETVGEGGAAQVSAVIVGHDLSNYRVEIEGPEELVEKLNAAFER